MITAEQMERINNYYDLKLNGKEIVVRTKESNAVQTRGIKGKNINFGFGITNNRTSKDETMKLINEGKVYSFSMTDFLKDYFKLTDEQIFELRTGQDKRTQEAIKEEMERIGLIEYYINDKLLPIDKVTNLHVYDWDITNEVYGWTDKKEFLAQLVIRCEIDDYYVEHYKFKTTPTQEILDAARLIQRFEELLGLSLVKAEYHKLTDNLDEWDRRIPEEKLTHWLDNSGETIIEKMMLAMKEQGKA